MRHTLHSKQGQCTSLSMLLCSLPSDSFSPPLLLFHFYTPKFHQLVGDRERETPYFSLVEFQVSKTNLGEHGMT